MSARENMISFTVYGAPFGKGRPRHTRHGRTYTPAKTAKAENNFRAQAIPHKPPQPIPKPVGVVLHLRFVFAVPASWSKRKTAAALAGEIRHTTTPDADNLAKLVEDAMNGIFWADDSQVWALSAVKGYGDTPRTEVKMSWGDTP